MAIRFLMKNLADLATISSSDFAASLPVTNLQVEGRGRVARTSNATGTKTINGNLAAASSINCCILSRHNLSASATWRLYLYSAANQTGTTLYDSTAVTPSPAASVFSEWDARSAFSTLYFTAVASVLSFRIELADATNSDGYLQAKRLLLGSYFEPAINAEYGIGLDWLDDSTQRRAVSGSIRADSQAKYRRLAGTLGRLTETERGTFLDACRYAGTAREVWVSLWPGATGNQERDYSLVGKFAALPRFANHEYNNHRAVFEIQES